MPKMLRLWVVLILFCFILKVHHASAESGNAEALRECTDLHRIDMHTIANAHAEYSNSKCMLTCYEGNKTLSVNAISEGNICDHATQSKCRGGHCKGLESVHQCSILHHLNLENSDRFKTAGSEYSADLCSLKCFIEGKLASVNPVNEGTSCITIPNGICRNGSCVSDAVQNTTIPTTIPPAPIDRKAQLLEDGQDLLVHAEEIIKTQSSNASLVNDVARVISGKAKVKQLIAQLEATPTNDPSISKTQLELSSAEIYLSSALLRIYMLLDNPIYL